MNIHKRFIVQFFIQLILVFIIFFFILLSIWAIIGFSIMNDEVTQDLSKADSTFFSDRITIQGKKVTFDDELKQLAKNQNGWLLVLTTKGDVIGAYNTSENVPSHFNESELAGLMLQNSSDPVEYFHWKLDEAYPQPQLLIFGRKSSETSLLNEVKTSIDWKNHHLNLSAATLKQIDEEEGWIQLINSTGKVLDGYGSEKEGISYTNQDIQTLSESEHDSVDAFFDAETEQTIIVGINHSGSTSIEENLFKRISKSILIIFIVLFLLLLTGTFWYARKFGVPLITMMKWIQNLGSGLYEQPLIFISAPSC